MNRPSGISRIIDASRILRVVLAAVVTMVMTGDPIVTVAAETGGGAQAALAAVVSIETRDAGGQLVGVGTGFFIHPDVITVPAHTLRGATTGMARVIGAHESLRFIGITALDPELDLALVKAAGICSLALPVSGGGPLSPGAFVQVFARAAGNQGGLVGSQISFESGAIELIMPKPVSPASAGAPIFADSGVVVGTLRPGFVEEKVRNQMVTADQLHGLVARESTPVSLHSSRGMSTAKEWTVDSRHLSTEAVQAGNFHWLPVTDATDKHRSYQFELLNRLQFTIRNIRFLIVFHAEDGSVFYSEAGQFQGRLAGAADTNAGSLLSNNVSVFRTAPKTVDALASVASRIEIRIVDFQIDGVLFR